jgi:hypothetical protein
VELERFRGCESRPAAEPLRQASYLTDQESIPLEAPPEQNSTTQFIRASGFLFFLFGLLAVVLRIIQFFVLGDPPLEELVVIMTPFAQTQLLRLIYNVLLGAGPLAIGYVLWRR